MVLLGGGGLNVVQFRTDWMWLEVWNSPFVVVVVVSSHALIGNNASVMTC